MINYTKETVIRNERSQFEVLKRIITTYRPAVIRVGILKPGVVPFRDEKTWNNEYSRIVVNTHGRYLIFGHIGEEVMKWLEDFGYRKNPKTEGPVENDPFVYKEFYMKLVGKDSQDNS